MSGMPSPTPILEEKNSKARIVPTISERAFIKQGGREVSAAKPRLIIARRLPDESPRNIA